MTFITTHPPFLVIRDRVDIVVVLLQYTMSVRRSTYRNTRILARPNDDHRPPSEQ